MSQHVQTTLIPPPEGEIVIIHARQRLAIRSPVSPIDVAVLSRFDAHLLSRRVDRQCSLVLLIKHRDNAPAILYDARRRLSSSPP